jgi:hypothetical protein
MGNHIAQAIAEKKAPPATNIPIGATEPSLFAKTRSAEHIPKNMHSIAMNSSG